MSIHPSKMVMQAAIEVAKFNNTPFGAALAMGDEVFSIGFNQSEQKNDPAAHAEIRVIRKLADQLQKQDLSGFTLYSTCEPCPRCMSAILGSGIKTVVYGCNIPTISNQPKQSEIRVAEMIQKSSANIELFPGFMHSECETLLDEYS